MVITTPDQVWSTDITSIRMMYWNLSIIFKL